MSHVDGIEPFALPLREPFETARGAIETREGFLVRVTVDGAPGVGEATPLAGWTESLADCEAALASIDEPAAVVDPPAGDGPLAETPAARHGVSLAVLDARARAAGVSLARSLATPTGDDPADRVPVNATIGDDDPDATVGDATAAVDAGFRCLKVKVGARPLAADRERLEAVRAACPDVELRADANAAWSPGEADRAFPVLAAVDCSFVEQPLAAADLAGHAALRRRHDVGVAIDEGLLVHGPDAVLAADAADVLVVKPMALGGVDRARRVALRARAAGSDVVVTTTIDGVIARTAAVHLAASLPGIRACGLATADRLAGDLMADPVRIVDGYARRPDGKGNIPQS